MWEVFNKQINEGEKRQLWCEPTPGYRIPITAVNGANPGKTVMIIAGTHSMENPAIPAVTRVAKEIDPAKTNGRVIIVHTMTWSSIWERHIRFVVEDHGNLNGVYPGRADGTVSERIAYYFATKICPQCDFILDFHSGAAGQPLDTLIFFPRKEGVREISLEVSKKLGVTHLIESGSSTGIYSYAANYLGVPGIILERGTGGFSKPEWVDEDERDAKRVLNHFGVYDFGDQGPVPNKILCTKCNDINADAEGFWIPEIEMYGRYKKGDRIGYIQDIWGNKIKECFFDCDCMVYYYTDAPTIKPGWMLCTIGVDGCMNPID